MPRITESVVMENRPSRKSSRASQRSSALTPRSSNSMVVEPEKLRKCTAKWSPSGLPLILESGYETCSDYVRNSSRVDKEN